MRTRREWLSITSIRYVLHTHTELMPSKLRGVRIAGVIDRQPIEPCMTEATPLLGECLFLSAALMTPTLAPYNVEAFGSLDPIPCHGLHRPGSRRNVDQRPVDALVCCAGVSKARASIQTDGVVGRRAHVLQIDALFCKGLVDADRRGMEARTRRRRQVKSDSTISHDVPILPISCIGAVVHGDVGHILPG
jgi:hypothetical protein